MELLTVPATKKWLMGRVSTLLTQYFVSAIPVEVMTGIAEDWNAELRAFPPWAIQNACRWWLGAENRERRYKPMPGDISARCRKEMGVVKCASFALAVFERDN